ncbi:hypothetical protein IAQ61_009543 [Plenodomus lingam]|uniref:Carbonic anhydrase n=1 Tax=Leptosphaeria maculans (strain JN3 / isolate v23.1.3 / race Av1-4-5-6-7-8) TaxID=985895 RepID=E4ZTM2_LEPMJ|nr:hypothetical protein LEMA_P118810.1 [Plenodomus lingam JN3]KAH9863266.1 hypothetical protein IAQ61_009543 [Plenodomus lingam]CBX94878.1 hypothetical protein LEMA_P118810.1 [Plenodomus lingam JN3]
MLFNVLFLASTATATCTHGLSMFKRATTEVNSFGFGPMNGPFNWAALAPENEACRTGRNQSPINIDGTIRPATAKPVLNIPAGPVEFENLGTTIEVIVNGTTDIGGTAFRLVQFHMHTPSEHHINSEYYPLEIHMVHQGVADNTQLAVVALMFEVSARRSSSIIRSLSAAVPKIATPGTTTPIAKGIDFSDVISTIRASNVLSYSGSLTTPPCAEGVTFLIVEKPLDISVADFNSIKRVVKFNSRFVQNTLGQDNILEVGARSGSAAPRANRSLPPSSPSVDTGARRNVQKRTPKY